MNITPITKNVDTYAQKLQKEGKVFVQSLTKTPTYKMGGWTMRGYGMLKEAQPAGAMLYRLGEFAKPLNSVNYLV